MNEIENDLAQASEKTTTAQDHTAEQVKYRNYMINKALGEGVTWARVIELTGLSRQTIANIVKDAK